MLERHKKRMGPLDASYVALDSNSSSSKSAVKIVSLESNLAIPLSKNHDANSSNNNEMGVGLSKSSGGGGRSASSASNKKEPVYVELQPAGQSAVQTTV